MSFSVRDNLTLKQNKHGKENLIRLKKLRTDSTSDEKGVEQGLLIFYLLFEPLLS